MELYQIVKELEAKKAEIDTAIAALKGLYRGVAVEKAPEHLAVKAEEAGRGLTLEDAMACLMADGVTRDSWEVCHELKKIGLNPKRVSVLASLSKHTRRGEYVRVKKGTYRLNQKGA